MNDKDRMKGSSIAFAFLLLGACQREPQPANETKAHFEISDADIEKIRKEEPGLTDFCLDKFKSGDGSYVPDEQCFKFGPPQRMSGKWWAIFEGSQFCPQSSTNCDPGTVVRSRKPNIWLGFAQPIKIDWDRYMGGLYSIDFVGRRTVYPGHYGHMGGAEEEVIVDRIISIRQLKAPPPPPSKAEVIAYSKKCEAEKTCIPNWSYINSMDE